MAVARPILGLLAIILLAGGIVLQFLIVLSGLYNTPENQIYFLQANTDGISGSNVRNPARWTYLRLCGVDNNGHNANCLGTAADYPFDPVRNFNTITGVPPQLLNTSHYFYLSRIGWAFYLVALFFAVIAIFISLAALFARLGAYLTGLTTFLAAFFQAVAASLMTAWVIQGEHAFKSNGQITNTKIGVKAMAFTWAAFAAWFLAALFFCVGGSVSKSSSTSTSKSKSKNSYFGRKRSTRSRGSFIDSESGPRVKDEYE